MFLDEFINKHDCDVARQIFYQTLIWNLICRW